MARNVQEFIIYYLVPPLAMMVVSFPKLCTNQGPSELVLRHPLLPQLLTLRLSVLLCSPPSPPP